MFFSRSTLVLKKIATAMPVEATFGATVGAGCSVPLSGMAFFESLRGNKILKRQRPIAITTLASGLMVMYSVIGGALIGVLIVRPHIIIPLTIASELTAMVTNFVGSLREEPESIRRLR